jgi:RHS repeat-associated protein
MIDELAAPAGYLAGGHGRGPANVRVPRARRRGTLRTGAITPWRLVAGGALLVAVVGLALWHGLAAEPPVLRHVTRAGVSSPRGLSTLPLTAQAEISAALGDDQGAYRISRLGSGYQALNPAQRLRARFDRSGVLVQAGGLRLGLGLGAAGHGAAPTALAPGLPRAQGNRVVYFRSGLSGWYTNGPLGLEQGFTLARAPSGDPREPLTLSLALSGNTSAEIDSNGRGLQFTDPQGKSLRYDDLLATDAGGRPLHSWITLQPGHVLLHVDALDARYPLRIDPLIQQGSNLTGGTEETGAGEFGYSVEVSADGNTALVGADADNGYKGAAWVFTRSEGKWTQQGSKLTGAEETGEGEFGYSVALSSEGNTALIGGLGDNSLHGAAWVFTRSEGKWTQQGAKLTDGTEGGCFGVSVALSSSGNTALVGAYVLGSGAAWPFTRSEGKWTRGPKITSEEATGEATFGHSVALSANGNTALIGGYNENVSNGAAWVFTRSEEKWTQQGKKLTGGTSGAFGMSVALSSDGNTALIGAPYESSFAGAAWVFTRSEEKWTQQAKLTSEGGELGWDVALSANGGNTALLGSAGAGVVVFKRSGGSWTQQGSRVTGGGLSVALSSSGSTALVGRPAESSDAGAVAVYVDYTPTPEESYGSEDPASPKNVKCACGDPVDNANGNLTERQTDLSIGGRGPGLALTRTYNAQLAATAEAPGAFGYGWTGPYSAHLAVEEATGTATVYQDNGSAVEFYSSGGAYVAGAWVEATLAKEGTGYVYTLPDQTKLVFNSSGQLTKEEDRNGNAITLAYNAEKRLETATDGDGRALTFKYNVGGQVESVKDPMGHVIEYSYESGNLMSVKLEAKVRWKFEYNASHELTKLTDGRSDATTIEYDGSHRAIKQVLAGHERKWKYGTGETTLTEPNGSETVEHFNEIGEPTEVTRAKGTSIETTTKYEYSTADQLTKRTDGDRHATEYGYDTEDNRTSEKDPRGDEWKWTYDKTHDVATETTPEGETTTIKRNGRGDPEVVERPIGSETQKTEYKYDEKGDLTEVIDPLKHATKYTYDAAGDKETETDPEGDERKWRYNEDSQETEETDPRKFTTKTERNEQGRPIKVTDPLGHTIEYKYDGNGNIESETDSERHTTKYTYNEENLRTKVEEPNKTVTETGYDNDGQMTSHTDGNGHKWEYKRNQLEQITEEVNPLKHVTKKEYDADGNLTKTEDPEKHTVEYTYDESDRRKAVKYSTGKPAEVTFEYNKDSKVTKMTDGTGTTENTYDKLGRLTQYKNGAGKVVKYEYNLANEPTKITYPNEKSVTRAYDKDDRLEKITDWFSRSDTFGYNADSQLTSITYPAEVKYEDKYVYNEADEMTELKLIKAGETVGYQEYDRDSDGKLTKTVNHAFPGAVTWEYKYDENGRLVEGGGLGYEYDKANNPTKIEGKGPYTYNAADELEKGPEATYAYNEDGRRTETKPTTGPTTTYGYDQAGNLTSVTRPEAEEVKKIEDSYTYDGDDLRESQTINGTTTNLTWDTAEEVPRILSDESNYYLYGPNNLVIEQITGGATHWMHYDQQGSMRAMMNGKGEIEAAYTFNPFGSLNSMSHANNSLLRYDGEYMSTDNGLLYLRARTYDPSTAQFLSVDPALQSTGEPYAYTRDDPLNEIDPTGEQPPFVWPPFVLAPWSISIGRTFSASGYSAVPYYPYNPFGFGFFPYNPYAFGSFFPYNPYAFGYPYGFGYPSVNVYGFGNTVSFGSYSGYPSVNIYGSGNTVIFLNQPLSPSAPVLNLDGVDLDQLSC